MNRVTNPLMLIMPEEMFGLMLLFMIVAGGLLLIVRKNKRPGWTLISLAIAMPFINVLVEAVMNDLFNAIPESWVQPVAWSMMIVLYLILAGVVLTLLFGKKAIDNAIGQLLADTIKGIFKLLFKWPVMLVLLSFLGYSYWKIS